MEHDVAGSGLFADPRQAAGVYKDTFSDSFYSLDQKRPLQLDKLYRVAALRISQPWVTFGAGKFTIADRDKVGHEEAANDETTQDRSMTKPVPLSDFRAQRHMLEKHEYAMGGEEVAPTDLIEKRVWDGITHLPDDIAMRISSHHGSQLRLLYQLWGDWVGATGDPEKPDNLFNGMLDAADCFQCATFNLLHGYYRSALADLRSALELVAIGAFGDLKPDDPVYRRWQSGGADLTFPSCRKRLHKAAAGAPFAWFVKAGAWPERLYYDLCRYTHSRADGSDGSLWESNGPVYNGRAIKLTHEMTLCVYATSYLLAKIGRISLAVPDGSKIVFELNWLSGHEETTRAFEQLYD